MSNTLQSIAEQSLDIWLRKLNLSPYECHSKPQILLNQRGRIAGAALLQKNVIKLQPSLFEQNQDYFISDVIPHELAHLVVYQHFGRVKPHGNEWRYVMRDVLGVAPKVTHSLDVKKAGVKMFDYQCHCGIVQLTTIRHNRVVHQQQKYICRRCEHTLIRLI